VKNNFKSAKPHQPQTGLQATGGQQQVEINLNSKNDKIETKLVRLPITLIVFFYLRPWEMLPFLSVLHPSAVLTIGTTAWVLLSANVDRKQLFACPTTGWVIALTVGLAASIPLTMYPGLNGLQNFMTPLSIFLALTAVVRSKKTLIYCLCTLLFCMDCHAVSVSHTYFTGNYTDRVTGFVGGEFIGANSLGAFFVMTLPIAWYLWSELRNKTGRIFALLSLVILLLAILSTQSRGGMIGLGVLIVLSICLSRKKLKAALIFAAIIAATIPAISPEQLERYTFISVSQEEMDPSSASRIYAWEKGIKMFLDYPIAGVGIGQFSMAFGKHYRGDDWGDKFGKSLGYNAFLRPHNIFIQSLAETGGIGFLGFIMILVTSLRSAWQTIKNNNEYSFYAKCLIASAVAYFTCMLFDHHAFSTPTFTLFALLVIPEIITIRASSKRFPSRF